MTIEQEMDGSAPNAQHDVHHQAPPTANKRPSAHKAHTHTNAMLRRIRAASRSGKHKQAEALSRVYLGSMDARYAATLVAYHRLKPHVRPDVGSLFAVAQSLDPYSGTQEDVYLRFKPKKGNPDAFRPILEFGIENRALQYLVLPLLRARSQPPHRCQYDRRGTRRTASPRLRVGDRDRHSQLLSELRWGSSTICPFRRG